MSNERANRDIKCPYFRQERSRRKTPAGCEGSYYISCEGLLPGSYGSEFFRSGEEKKAVRKKYCTTDWQKCPRAAALNRIHETE